MGYNIAIDGPAGAGKSTIAKIIAKDKGFIYVDTGAMYRALAIHFLRNGVDGNDEDAVSKSCLEAEVSLRYDDGVQVVLLNDENVNAYLRTEEVGNMASLTSKYAKVRERLTLLQKELAKNSDVVMDGRDIGTVVLPNADLKIYLTASADVRAQRRCDELAAKDEEADFEKIKEDIIARDYQDMHREVAPLRQAEDAKVVDSSFMTIEEVVATIEGLCK